MANRNELREFSFDQNDPLASEHEVVKDWVQQAVTTLSQHSYYEEADLKSTVAGERILKSKNDKACRLVEAALSQTKYWDELAEQIRDTAENDQQRMNAHRLPGWQDVWCRRRQAAVVIKRLMRRKLALTESQLVELVEWCTHSGGLSAYHYPLNSLIRALERFAAENKIQGKLLEALREFSVYLRANHDKEICRLGTSVEQLCGEMNDGDEMESVVAKQLLPPPKPALAGSPNVFQGLKRQFKMLPDSDEGEVTNLRPDGFPLLTESPYGSEHNLLSSFYQEVADSNEYHRPNYKHFKTGKQLLKHQPLANLVLAATERRVHSLASQLNLADSDNWGIKYAIDGSVDFLLDLSFDVDRQQSFDLLLYLSTRPTLEPAEESLVGRLIEQIDAAVATEPLTEGERFVLSLVRNCLISGPPLGKNSPQVAKVTRLIQDDAAFCVEPGEHWADRVNLDFTKLKSPGRKKWSALFQHALSATAARPTKKWMTAAKELIKDIGGKQVRKRIEVWLPLVSQGRSISRMGSYIGDARGFADTMNDENATILRGLLWMVPLLPKSDDLARLVSSVAFSAYKKVPGVGPRAVKVGNAAVYTLSQLGAEAAVGQLAMLKVRVKFGTAQKEIEKAYNVAAEALGLARDEIEEMGVPSYGLEAGGRIEEVLGDYRAELIVSGTTANLHWFDAKQKQLKSVPAKVKNEFKDELKELKQSLKDIQGMLPAQRDRIDSMFLLQKNWPISAWRERYLEHPLVGAIACRLIWNVDQTAALFLDGKPTDVNGKKITIGKTAEVSLWHPVGHSTDQVLAWRQRLESLEITQPFKQAHREVYLLTEAERNTGTYSNRFAAHIIRQHQFNALCAARGWKNRLRLMVDDSYLPPYKELPKWGLRAEFWVEGIGDDYGVDTNESGVFLRLATDQVRFYRSEAASNYVHAGGGGYSSEAAGPGQEDINEPVPVEQIPPLVLSEIMRDVDLFVGVASVGNDPTWQDGGPEGRYREYWHSYSFGELSGTASTRKVVLERLIPRLKIADQCSFSDRFLIVTGSKRTYKIHLGSGNILMEPNDQYLCIVPDRRTNAKQDDLFLPFEGDNMLSIILSKALLLAADNKIKDRTILSQINGL